MEHPRSRRWLGHATIAIGLAMALASGGAVVAQSPSVAPASPDASFPAATPLPTPCVEPAPPSPAASPDAAATPAAPVCPPSGSGYSWRRVELPATGGVWPVRGVAVNGGGDMVVLGQTPGEKGKPLAWHSVDGVTWDAVKIAWPRKTGPFGLATLGNQFLAIGGGAGGPVIATSGAGDRWAVRKPGIKGATGFLDLATTADGVALLGTTGKAPVAAVWTTFDGQAWTKAALPPSPLGDPATLIAASPIGMLGAASRGGSLWVAPDGVTWMSVPLPTSVPDTYPAAITGIPAGLMLVLNHLPSGGTPDSSVWTTTDGTTWQQVHSLAGSALFHASSGPSGILIQGTSTLVTSLDGVTWTDRPLIDFAGYYLIGLTQTPDGRVLTAGQTIDGTDGAAWIGTPLIP